MRTLIFYSFPVSGHINPTLKLMEDLIKNGDTVIYYASAQYKNKIEAIGACFKDYNETGVSLNLDLNLAAKDMTLLTLSKVIVEFLHSGFPTLLKDAKKLKPDYIGLDFFSIWGRMIANSLNIKAFTSVPQFAANPKKLTLFPGMLKNIVQLFVMGQPEIRKFKKTIKNFNSQYNSGIYNFLDLFVNYTNMNIVFVLKDLQPDSEDFDDSFIFAGPSIKSEEISSSEEFHFPEKYSGELIYISLGTMYNKNLAFYKKCFEIFQYSKYRIIMSVGNSIQIDEIGKIPENIIVKNHVSQLNVLREADLFISHGGMNSVNEALFCGVPLILIPQAVDQYSTAQVIDKFKVGYYFKEKILSSKILDKIEFVLNNNEMKQNLEQTRNRIIETASNTNLLDIIDNYLEK